MINIKWNSGDDLSAIALKYLGKETAWEKIAEVNALDIMKEIAVGQILQIPEVQDLQNITSIAGNLSEGLDANSLKELANSKLFSTLGITPEGSNKIIDFIYSF